MATSLYRLTFDATLAQGATPDDLLAPVIAEVDSLTLVEAGSAKRLPGGIVSVRVDYWGLNPNEAQRTAEEAVSHSTLGTAALSFDSAQVRAL